MQTICNERDQRLLGTRGHDYKEAQGVSWDDRNVLGGGGGGYVGMYIS